jgi:GT2 family glycosyltransferase
VDLSVLIPTCGRPHKLSACISALSRQSLPRERYEVLVGIDGPEDGELGAMGSVPSNFTILSFPKAGPAATRNRLLEHARGKYLLWLSESMVPSDQCLEAHLMAQGMADGKGVMVMGATPWIVHQPDRLFDKLIRERGAMCAGQVIRAAGHEPGYDWGYRHAWSVNLSMPADAPRRLGGFVKQLSKGAYEDVEMAWRLQRWLGMPLHFNPEASAHHDRRHDPLDLLKHEAGIGFEAMQLAVLSPQCARELFGRDVASPNEHRYTKGYVQRDRGPAEQGLWTMLSLAHQPLHAMSIEDVRIKLDTLDEQTGILRRWLWRRGLWSAQVGEPMSKLHEAIDDFVAEARKRRTGVRAA